MCVVTARVPPLVFLGPTLPVAEARALLTASFRPPAVRGDIYRALVAGHTTIVLIDGEFHGRPSVWQREIADALVEGAVVHGASSMGAIRAAELHTYGMIGHGRIFEWYRDGKLDGDDEVALAYGPSERGYPALSEPLVNIRATLEEGVPEIVSTEERDEFIDFAKELYYPERSFAALLERGPAVGWPAERRRRLQAFLNGKRVDQKRKDAITALTALATMPFDRCCSISDGFAETLWRRERLAAEGLLPVRAVNTIDNARRAGMSDEEIRALRCEMSALFFVALWGRAHGVVATDADFAAQRACFPSACRIPAPRLKRLLAARALADAAVRTFCAAHHRRATEEARRAIIRDWANENGIEQTGLQGDSLVDWVIEAGPTHFGYLWRFDVEIAETLWLLGRLQGVTPQEVG